MSATQDRVKKRRRSWEICADAAAEMRTILDELEKYSGVYEETTALRKRLDRIDKACARGRTASNAASGNEAVESVKVETAVPTAPAVTDPIEAGGDPKIVAQNLIAQMPLQKIFQDPVLSDAFLSELFLALARESTGQTRRERQRQGIEEAKAQGVRFGAPRRPLPDNFEEVRRAWRNGEFSLSEAAEQCGMAKSTFYNAAQRAEQAMEEPVSHESAPEARRSRRSAASARLS